MHKRHVVFSLKDLFVSEKNKKTVSSPAVDFASRKQGWNSLWFARLAFQNNRARKKACCLNCKYNSSLPEIYNIFSITTVGVIIKKLKRMSTCCSTTEGSWKNCRFSSCAFDQNFSGLKGKTLQASNYYVMLKLFWGNHFELLRNYLKFLFKNSPHPSVFSNVFKLSSHVC